jgi:hypothetical protein
VTPAYRTVNLGVSYEMLSTKPFDFGTHNALQNRILTPLLAHILFFGGNLYLFFPLLVSVVFLATVYIHFRRDSYTPTESIGVTALMAFSTPVLCTLHFQGYTDTMSYLLIWLCLIVKPLSLRCFFFSLALLNHESNAFCLPFLVYRPWEDGYNPRRTILYAVCFLVSFAPALAYRWYVTSQTEVLYSTDIYLNTHKFADPVSKFIQAARLLPIGVFEAFRLFWFIPICAVALLIKRNLYGRAFWILLVVVCVSLQLLIANDTSRLIGLAFPAVLMGTLVLKTHLSAVPFERGIWLLIILNFFVPVYYVDRGSMCPFLPLPVSLILRAIGVDAWSLWWK